MAEPLAGYSPSRCQVRVRFGETDLMGIVHHAAYLSYFEVGRVEYLRRRGIDYVTWCELGLHLPVIEARLRYRKPARFDEELEVETNVVALSRASVTFGYVVKRGAELIAEGDTRLACVNERHAVTRIPPALAEALQRDEGTDGDPAAR